MGTPGAKTWRTASDRGGPEQRPVRRRQREPKPGHTNAEAARDRDDDGDDDEREKEKIENASPARGRLS